MHEDHSQDHLNVSIQEIRGLLLLLDPDSPEDNAEAGRIIAAYRKNGPGGPDAADEWYGTMLAEAIDLGFNVAGVVCGSHWKYGSGGMSDDALLAGGNVAAKRLKNPELIYTALGDLILANLIHHASFGKI